MISRAPYITALASEIVLIYQPKSIYGVPTGSYFQAEGILRETLLAGKSVDRWTACQCLAFYGECDSDVVGELVSQLLNSEDGIRRERAAVLLAKLSENSVRKENYFNHIHDLLETLDPYLKKGKS